ncbi:MAG TPA: HlyD family efflux transporter periplasmic adaptor subunit [Gemmatimonadaceae bacterium]|nr:HlyD family efflux transporter periplasmic adaptor subunit [Gemmatimonadaceae bacterium]
MAPRHFHPAECIADSLEQHVVRHQVRPGAIYVAVVLAALAALAALPLVHVRVSVQSEGLIRPATEKHDIRSRVSGVVERVLVHENQLVVRGAPLVVVRSVSLAERGRLLHDQAEEKRRFISDLQRLVRDSGTVSTTPTRALHTPKYRREYLQYVGALRDARIRIAQATRALDRARTLGDRGFATQSSVQDRAYELAQATSARALTVARQMSEWQSALTSERSALEELESQMQQLHEERSHYTVRAAVGGSVEQLASLSPGSYVEAGEQIGVISPNSALVAEIYVTPRDIGLLRPGIPVRLLIDAFNATEWGALHGQITAISSDFILVGQSPMFKVRCDLERPYLTLPSGVRGRLKKGMTLRARFLLARRSLLQLLHDDVDDWLNPVRAPQPPHTALHLPTTEE